MNNKGQVWGILIFVAFLFILVAFATIDPLIENLNSVRNSSNLNCPDVIGFNQTAFDEHNATQKLTFRPTCFATGMILIWFIVAFLFGVVMWVVVQIKKLSQRR